MEKVSPESTHFLPLKPPLSESVKVVFRNFDHFRSSSLDSGHDKETAILDGMRTAFQSNYLCDAPKWNLKITEELVDHFLSYPNRLYPKMFKRWYRETCEGIVGEPMDDDKRVLSLLAIARRKIHPRERRKIH